MTKEMIINYAVNQEPNAEVLDGMLEGYKQSVQPEPPEPAPAEEFDGVYLDAEESYTEYDAEKGTSDVGYIKCPKYSKNDLYEFIFNYGHDDKPVILRVKPKYEEGRGTPRYTVTYLPVEVVNGTAFVKPYGQFHFNSGTYNYNPEDGYFSNYVE